MRPKQTDPKHAHAARTPFALLVLGLIGGGMCTLLLLNTASAANEVSRHDLATKDQGVSASLVQVRNAVAASSAPGNLAAAAAALGMVPAGNPGFLEIDKSGRVRVLGSAAPASAIPVYVPPPTSPKPKPSSTAKSSAKSTAKSTGKSSGKSTGKPSSTTTATHGSTHGKTPPRHTPTPTRHPTPTSTPTPIVMLPGGAR